MVARLSEFPTHWVNETAAGAGKLSLVTTAAADRLAVRGQLLLERAKSLGNVRIGKHGIPGFSGAPLHIADSACHNQSDSFIRDRVFAVIANDGAMCLRLPEDIADDLIYNGLCVRAGKNMMTWPITSDFQLEVSWRILLHAYWKVTETSTKHRRRMWSEFVIQH